MKCISLIQPWASLVMLGAKRLETRSWKTAHRGRLAIHASRKWDARVCALCASEPFRLALWRANFDPRGWDEDWTNLPLGAILGIVDLAGCYTTEDVRRTRRCGGEPWVGEDEAAFGDYSPGRWAWEMRDPQPFARPLPWRGALRLFDVPDEAVGHMLDS